MIPSPRNLRDAAGNVTHKVLYGRLADLRKMPADLIDDGHKRTVYRYRPAKPVIPTGPPVLLVPPLAADAAAAFDLRRGCSLAEHLVSTGRRTYLVDYGQIAYADRDLGLEHWIDEVLPGAIRKVSEDAGGQPVQLVGWCLGGIFAVLTAAAHRDLPIASLTSIAAPVDFDRLTLAGPLRPLTRLTGGAESVLLTMFGGIPQPLVKRGYQLLGIDKYLMRPLTVLANLNNADLLAQIEAVDAFTDRMLAYPGRTIGQIYESFFRRNDLARGTVSVAGRDVHLSDVAVPALVIAGRSDGIAPWRAVHPLTRLLTGSPKVRFDTAPGGHLGVLTGRAARSTTWTRLGRWLDENALSHGLRAPRAPREVASHS
ncbi:alpha/beta fold hydrolase [Actinocorallia lasiicapitis]